MKKESGAEAGAAVRPNYFINECKDLNPFSFVKELVTFKFFLGSLQITKESYQIED